MAEESQVYEIVKLYTKDFSLEAPNNPNIFKEKWEPDINLNVSNQVNDVDEKDHFEISITLTATVKLGEKTAYLIEVEQAGIFKVAGFTDEQRGYMLGAISPNVLFPYARETISSMSQKAGFPPLLLNPIDFNSIYQQHVQRTAEKMAEEAKQATTH